MDERLSGLPFEVDGEYYRKSREESEIERLRRQEILPSKVYLFALDKLSNPDSMD